MLIVNVLLWLTDLKRGPYLQCHIKHSINWNNWINLKISGQVIKMLFKKYFITFFSFDVKAERKLSLSYCKISIATNHITEWRMQLSHWMNKNRTVSVFLKGYFLFFTTLTSNENFVHKNQEENRFLGWFSQLPSKTSSVKPAPCEYESCRVWGGLVVFHLILLPQTHFVMRKSRFVLWKQNI